MYVFIDVSQLFIAVCVCVCVSSVLLTVYTSMIHFLICFLSVFAEQSKLIAPWPMDFFPFPSDPFFYNKQRCIMGRHHFWCLPAKGITGWFWLL